MVVVGNSWALLLSGGELSPVGSCPRTASGNGQGYGLKGNGQGVHGTGERMEGGAELEGAP